MRKIFWCSVAVAVAAAGSVYLASRHVEQPPFASVGHALLAMGGDKAPSHDDLMPPGAIPGLEDPVPVGDDSTGVFPVVSAVEPLQGHIIIGEFDVNPMTPEFAAEPAPAPQTTNPPAVMPYCQEEQETGVPMPYADACDEDLCGDVWHLLRVVAEEARREMRAAEEEAAEYVPVMPEEVAPEGAEDYDYHKHHPCCPYTGGCMPVPHACPPAPTAPEPKTNNDEVKEQRRSLSKKVMIGEGVEEEQDLPTEKKIDTMEFRPSDAGFQPFIPGPF